MWLTASPGVIRSKPAEKHREKRVKTSVGQEINLKSCPILNKEMQKWGSFLLHVFHPFLAMFHITSLFLFEGLPIRWIFSFSPSSWGSFASGVSSVATRDFVLTSRTNWPCFLRGVAWANGQLVVWMVLLTYQNGDHKKPAINGMSFGGENRWVFLGWKKENDLQGPIPLLVYIYIYMATGSILEPKLLSIWGSWKLILLVLAKHLTNCGSWGTRHDFQHTICSGALGSSMPVPCQSFSTFSLHHLSFPVQCHLPMNQESYTCSIMIKGETSN